MGKIIPTLDRTRLSNLESLYTAIKNSTIKNKFVQAGILAVCAKESGFTLVAELDWRSTKDPKYIRSIFGSKLAELTDKQIIELKNDPEDWFDYLYGGQAGNSQALKKFNALNRKLPRSEGYKYRGRGYNQLTFKGNYEFYSKLIKVDIVTNPDSMLKPDVAAKVLVAYMVSSFQSKALLAKWGVKDTINNVNNLLDGVGLPYHATGGAGYSKQAVIDLVPTGWKRANEYAAEFYEWILKKEGIVDPGITSTPSSSSGPQTTQGGTSSGTSSVASDSTAIAQDKSRGDIQGQEGNTSNPSTQKTEGELKKNIIQIAEPRLKPTVIKMQIPPGEQTKKEYQQTIALVPFVWYGSYQIEYKNIEFLQLYTSSGIPALKMVFLDTFNLMKDSAFPLDDTIITVFINPRSEQLKPIHLDFKIINFSVDKRTYTITGTLDANGLYTKKFKSFSNRTSYDALKDISGEVGLGFASNIDTTNDKMSWICTGQRYVEFIESIVNNSYKSDETYLSAYIDFYYNLIYVDVEKENSRNIREELGVGNIGLNELAKEKKEILSRLLLTNDKAFRDTNNYFAEHRVMNNSTSISLREGYSTKIKYYDQIKKEFLVFDIDSLTSSEEDKIILKGKPQDEGFYKENTEVVYFGKLDEDNMFANYHYSYVQNYRNLVELGKISIEIYMKSPNFNLYRYQKILVTISNQSPNITSGQMNARLTGEWLIVDITYRYESGRFTQVIKVVKRELETGPNEKPQEVTQKKKRDTGRGTSENPDPSDTTTSQTQTSITQTTAGTQSGGDTTKPVESVPETTNETAGMNFTVPPPPQTPTKSSPSNFPVKATSFKKIERNPTQIVIHYTAGWQVLDKGAGTIDFLMNGRTDAPGGLSYHYIISVDGHIENVVDPKYQAAHSGFPINEVSIGISLSSLGTTFDSYGVKGANDQVDTLRKSSNSYKKSLYGKNEDYVKLVDFDGNEKKYRGFTSCQEVSVAQIVALEKLLKQLKNKFPTLPSYKGLTREHYDILFPQAGVRKGSFGLASWKQGTTEIYSHCSIEVGKVDIAPTPRLINFFKRLRL
jgi:hypothetical protein